MEARRPRGPSVREAAARDLARAGGLDAPIEIVQYDPEWPTRFASERERLLPLLMGAEIHHIGSTAVPGMPAKLVATRSGFIHLRKFFLRYLVPFTQSLNSAIHASSSSGAKK